MAKQGSTTRKSKNSVVSAGAAGAVTVTVWEEDPASSSTTSRPVPNMAAKPLAYSFSSKGPKPGNYAPGTPEFRYWTAAESLRRGADFWLRVARVERWQPGAKLNVELDAGEDLNANYDRTSLNFFHGPSPQGGFVYSGESPDVVCHEMGHAILDAIKPELWDSTAFEIAAFHESFGDVSAILSAIQLPSLREAVLADTGGHLSRSSRLSRLAEQMGAAIRALYPGVAETDCLRNAVNSFTYSNPQRLPTDAPASQLSSEPHSLSRVFTGAVFEILAALLVEKAGAGPPTEAQLLAAGDDLAAILIEGIRNSAVVPNWYAQVAAAMVQASHNVDPVYPAILKGVFVRRAVLSLHSAASLHQFAAAAPARALSVRGMAQAPATSELALPADHYGLDGPLLVQAATEPRPFTALSMVAHEQVESQSPGEAARIFVDDLFRRGRVDYAGHGDPAVRLVHKHKHQSHRLERVQGGFRLKRVFFDCGFCG